MTIGLENRGCLEILALVFPCMFGDEIALLCPVVVVAYLLTFSSTPMNTISVSSDDLISTAVQCPDLAHSSQLEELQNFLV